MGSSKNWFKYSKSVVPDLNRLQFEHPALNQLVKNMAYFLGKKSNATEFTQYRNPVGLGPSSKT